MKNSNEKMNTAQSLETLANISMFVIALLFTVVCTIIGGVVFDVWLAGLVIGLIVGALIGYVANILLLYLAELGKNVAELNKNVAEVNETLTKLQTQFVYYATNASSNSGEK